ncbi:putative bZIP transcription factor [Xylaria nigripes]|nr:putative bZIP transcription factor [Xylaria nigripes]
MDNEHQDNAEHQTQPPHPESSDSSSSSSLDNPDMDAPVSTRPNLPSRRNSGTLIVPRDSYEVIEHNDYEADVGAMSPRRTTEDLEALGREAREELHRHARVLQESLLMLFDRVEAVRQEHDKLDSHNKFLQKYIGDLMSTSKITASSSRGRK